MSESSRPADDKRKFFPVPPLMILPHTSGDFEVWLEQEGRFILYTKGRDGFTLEHRRTLYEHGVKQIFIPSLQREAYEEYVERNLGEILSDEKLPLDMRARVLYEASADIVQETFENRLPESFGKAQFKRIMALVEHCTAFLRSKDSLKTLNVLISHDYKTYTHSLNVMIFSVTLMEHLKLSKEELKDIGLGAMLHDIGKALIPKKLLNKKGPLNHEEWGLIQSHPTLGAALCASLPLSHATLNCILFHHEKMDGSGFPSGLAGERIPLEVRAVSLANVYDALTSETAQGPPVSPFAALRIMRDQMEGAFDQELYKQMVLLLSGAGIVIEP